MKHGIPYTLTSLAEEKHLTTVYSGTLLVFTIRAGTILLALKFVALSGELTKVLFTVTGEALSMVLHLRLDNNDCGCSVFGKKHK